MGHRTGLTVHQGAMAVEDSDDTVTGSSDMAMRDKGNSAMESR